MERKELPPDDPTRSLLVITNSFTTPPLLVSDKSLPKPISSIDTILTTLPKWSVTPPEVKYTEVKQYAKLLDHPNRSKVVDPFVGIGRSVFSSEEAVKLANLDALYHVTGAFTNLMDYRAEGDYSFAVLGAADSGTVEYLQYRRSTSHGYGLGTAAKERQNLKHTDLRTYTVSGGNDGSGSVLTNWSWFISMINRTDPELDVVLGYSDQYFDETKILRIKLIECLIALKTLAKSGSLVLKFYGALTLPTAQLLYLLSMCFERVSIIKPATSFVMSDEIFLVGLKPRPNNIIKSYVDLLQKVVEDFSNHSSEYLISLFPEALPSVFTNWLLTQNYLDLGRKINGINSVGNDGLPAKTPYPAYDLHKASLLFNIPAKPPPFSI